MAKAQDFKQGSTRGYLHCPASPTSSRGIVLTHGAGGNCQSSLLVALADQLADAGFWVLRYDLPFRQTRPFGPPAGGGARDREGLSQAAMDLRAAGPSSIFLAGHSYGGRQASILAVEAPGCCAGLLLLSYPLHAPKEPHKLRTEHFGQLHSKALFVHGTKDPFGTESELRDALRLLPADHALVMIQDVGHDLSKGGFDLRNQVIRPFCDLMSLEVEAPEQQT